MLPVRLGDDDAELLEFGFAEGQPLSCLSRFGEAGAQTHFRIVEAR